MAAVVCARDNIHIYKYIYIYIYIYTTVFDRALPTFFALVCYVLLCVALSCLFYLVCYDLLCLLVCLLALLAFARSLIRRINQISANLS